jgi:hypothetical protein
VFSRIYFLLQNAAKYVVDIHRLETIPNIPRCQLKKNSILRLLIKYYNCVATPNHQNADILNYVAIVHFSGYEEFHLLGYNILLATCIHTGFFLELFFDPEEGGEIFIRNVG